MNIIYVYNKLENTVSQVEIIKETLKTFEVKPCWATGFLIIIRKKALEPIWSKDKGEAIEKSKQFLQTELEGAKNEVRLIERKIIQLEDQNK